MMKKLAVLFMVLFCFWTASSVVMASEELDKETVAEVTDINEILDDIEVLDSRSITTHDAETGEDYRTWAQGDSRWGDIYLGASSYTMRRSGCLVTSITKLIVQTGLKNPEDFTPKTLVTWLNQNGGFTGSGNLYWGKPAECVNGLTYAGILLPDGVYDSKDYDDEMIDWILSGYHIVLQVKNRGHWIAVDEKQTLEHGKIYIMDTLPNNVNADLALIDRYPTINRVVAFKGGETPEVIMKEAVLRGKYAEDTDTNCHVRLDWTKVIGYRKGYWIERSEDNGKNWEVIKKITKGDTLSWVDKTTKSDTEYLYRIQPYNDNMEGGSYSNTVKIEARHVHKYKTVVLKRATTKERGKIKKTCKTCGNVKELSLYKIGEIELSYEKTSYNGKTKKPTVVVKNTKGNVIDPSYYTVKYESGRKNVGTYRVTVIFEGRYKGTEYAYFKIYPSRTSIKSLSGGKKQITVKWNKVDKQISGYEVRYSPVKGTSDNYKIKKINKKYSSSKINVVRSNATYYVKVRTYKTVDGVTYRSGWSETETVKTK